MCKENRVVLEWATKRGWSYHMTNTRRIALTHPQIPEAQIIARVPGNRGFQVVRCIGQLKRAARKFGVEMPA